jgi:hypothetical protein
MRRTTLVLSALALFFALGSVAADAGVFGIFGSYWDTDDLGETAGGGIKLAFGDRFRLRVAGTYYPDLSEDFDELVEDGDIETGDFEVEATVPELGFTFNLLPDSPFEFYIGAGGSYYLLDTNRFGIDDEFGWYGLLGFEIGGGEDGPAFFAEGLYRDVEGTVTDVGDDVVEDEFALDLAGIAINAGIVFRW